MTDRSSSDCRMSRDSEQIIKVHAKNKPLADDVTPKVLARKNHGLDPG